ncbi:glycosyltransferase family 2 protein [Oceanicella sp. SM1341]|uniref:glycosyltransferase family 2 protein n=1 Tax=Oceanicella sp. SM1341 TaxID=1548889 RepID=UPI000E469396|nr:glycosyltransferase [Oceanicella sp. SM1341]
MTMGGVPEAGGVVYTVALTSCGRFDLLDATLRSLIDHLDVPPAEIVVIEDGGDERVREVAARQSVPVRVMVNGERLGQMASIDRLYASIETPYVFHCEDDWEFFRKGFIAESARILEARPDISMVSLRDLQELNPLVRGSELEEVGGVPCYPLDTRLHPEYFGYSFNPGLRRLSDFRAAAPIEAIGGEEDISYWFRKRGFRYAVLGNPAVRHIGWERHVDDPTKPRRPRSLPERLARSVRKRVKRLRRLFGGA